MYFNKPWWAQRYRPDSCECAALQWKWEHLVAERETEKKVQMLWCQFKDVIKNTIN